MVRRHFDSRLYKVIFFFLLVLLGCISSKRPEIILQQFAKDAYIVTLVSEPPNIGIVTMIIKKRLKISYNEQIQMPPHKIVNILNDTIFVEYYMLGSPIDDTYDDTDHNRYEKLGDSIVLAFQYRNVSSTGNKNEIDVDSVAEKDRYLYMYHSDICIDTVFNNYLEYDGTSFFIRYFKNGALTFQPYKIRDKKFSEKYVIE